MRPPTTLAELPPPPFFERWFLEQPIPGAAAAAAAGIVLAVWLVRQGRLRGGVAAGASMVVLAAGLLALGWTVATPRERLTDRTAEFLRSCFNADAEHAATLLHDGLVIASAGDAFNRFGKQELVDLIGNFRVLRVRDWRQKARGAAIDAPGLGRAQASLFVTSALLDDRVMPSTWEFTWREGADGEWRLIRLECLTMWGQSPRRNWEIDALRLSRHHPPMGTGLRPDRY